MVLRVVLVRTAHPRNRRTLDTNINEGTFGVTTLLEIQLIKAKPYVELTYTPVHSIEEALTTMDTVTNDPSSDFVDGMWDNPFILHSKHTGLRVLLIVWD